MAIVLTGQAPSPQLFIDLRALCGWGKISKEIADMAIVNSLLWVSAKNNGKTIGFVRLIGDGALNFYVQDLIVTKAYREQGVGRLLMHELLSSCAGVVPNGATIGLMSVHGKEKFYEQFGFQSRPSGRFGAGMTLSYEPLTT